MENKPNIQIQNPLKQINKIMNSFLIDFFSSYYIYFEISWYLVRIALVYTP